MLESHLAALEPIFDLTPENDPCFAETTMVMVSKMMATLAGKDAGELAAEAKGEAYMAALEDLPSWAVQEAARHWYRSEHGPEHEYKWMPDPATLRRLANNEVLRVIGVQRQLRDLVGAEPLVEFDEDHKAAMIEKLPTPKLKRA